MKEDITHVPNDLIDKYIGLFEKPEQWKAVLDLIRQAYKFGYEQGATDEYKNIMGE